MKAQKKTFIQLSLVFFFILHPMLASSNGGPGKPKENVETVGEVEEIPKKGETKHQGKEVKKTSPALRYPKLHRWVGIFKDYGILLRPVSSEFVGKYYLGQPFTWETLRKAFVSICPEDREKVVADFKYHIVTKTGEEKGSAIGRQFGYISIGIDIIEHLYEGGVYSINIKPNLRTQSNKGKCEDYIVGGPLAYKIVPIDDQQMLLTLGRLGPLDTFMETVAFHGEKLKDEIRFTITSKGPRPFIKQDLEKPPELSPYALYSLTAIPFLLLGSYCFLIGYYSRFGTLLRDLPPLGTLKDYLYYNFSILFAWRTLIFVSIGILLYFMILGLDEYLTSLFGLWTEPVESGVKREVLVMDMNIKWWIPVWVIITAVAWVLIYLLWVRKWLPKKKIKLFALLPFASFLYLFLLPHGLDIRPREWPDTGNMIVNNSGLLLTALFWMYLRGIREGDLLIHRANRYLSTVTILQQEKLHSLSVVILGHLKEYLICFDPDLDAISVIPTKDIQQITPHAKVDVCPVSKKSRQIF